MIFINIVTKSTCTKTGEGSKPIQCEVCYSWVHATCEGLNMKEYDLFNKLSASVRNIAYCCNLIEPLFFSPQSTN